MEHMCSSWLDWLYLYCLCLSPHLMPCPSPGVHSPPWHLFTWKRPPRDRCLTFTINIASSSPASSPFPRQSNHANLMAGWRVERSGGFAFVYMEDERDAEDAIHRLDGIDFGRKGRRIRVEWTKEDRTAGRRGSSRRSPTQARPTKTLFVINFDPINTRIRDLERHFDKYGRVANVRIKKNFAFVQFEVQEDATRALEGTNGSHFMDRVISVEYALRDDDEKGERGNGYSPDRRGRERSPGRRRSPSPYGRGRERGSPDYGRSKERGSPDYGRGGRSPDNGRGGHSPDNGRGVSPANGGRGDHGRGGRSPDYDRERREASPRRERREASPGYDRSPSRSPGRDERD